MLNRLAIVIFLTPLLLAVGMSLLDVPITARDDINYLTELETRTLFTISTDIISWTYLYAVTYLTGLSELGLRIASLLILIATIVVLQKRIKVNNVSVLFVISVLPLYFNIYFNQIRIAVALFLFILLVTSKHFRSISVPFSALAHSSFLLFIFPPLAILIPIFIDIMYTIDPVSIGAVKYMAYLEAELAEMPWYFGWELGSIGLIYAASKRLRITMEVFIVVIAARMLGTDLSLDIARRILEIGMLAYSPLFLYMQRRLLVPRLLLVYFLLLGLLQSGISLYSGVIWV